MITQEQFDFTHVPDAELYNPDRVFWREKEAENAAWKAEMVRRKEAKREEQERKAKERAARLHAIKNQIPYSEAIATEICERIAVGELLLDICDDENMSSFSRSIHSLTVLASSCSVLISSLQEKRWRHSCPS